jgi:predicted DNA-binding protein (UPF0251 family)
MPRLKSLRKVSAIPKVKGFLPFGVESSSEEAVFLHLEEYEAFKLCDYDGMNHVEAAAMMGVSRPTFTRIYSAARSKIATAFAEGRSIEIEGGKVYIDSHWFHCEGCGCYFNHVESPHSNTNCPLCGSADINAFRDDTTEETMVDQSCYCLECGFEQEKSDVPSCSDKYCPECHVPLQKKTRKDSLK